MQFKIFAVLVCVWMCFIAIPAGNAHAASQVDISVKTILALQKQGAIDPSLKPHIRELSSVFRYGSYRLISAKNLRISIGNTGTVSLPGKRTLFITPKRLQGERAELLLKMNKNKKTVFRTRIQLLNNSSIIVGGPKYKKGDLIFKISNSF